MKPSQSKIEKSEKYEVYYSSRNDEEDKNQEETKVIIFCFDSKIKKKISLHNL